jgi:hypothetical protein
MRYGFVLERNGKEIAREKGNGDLKELAKRLDSIVVKTK